jgi:hypothetical protein
MAATVPDVMLCGVTDVTKILQQLPTCIFTVEEGLFHPSFVLKKQKAGSSKMCPTSEDSSLHSDCLKNLNSYTVFNHFN